VELGFVGFLSSFREGFVVETNLPVVAFLPVLVVLLLLLSLLIKPPENIAYKYLKKDYIIKKNFY
jgi:hypothetical protein